MKKYSVNRKWPMISLLIFMSLWNLVLLFFKDTMPTMALTYMNIVLMILGVGAIVISIYRFKN